MSSRDLTAVAFAELRRESQDIYNRIHSIAEDAEFVKQVHQHYRDFPLLPNMRCGAWYVDPDISSSQHAYFKSTDGHTNNWSFNLRRPNLHILPLIVQYRGLILVDSTRAGKRMPDALSKTVPIWCSVINRALLKCHPFGFDVWDPALYTPPGVVSTQEHYQIETKLDEWAAELAASFYEIPQLQRPLRPVWITPATSTYPDLSPDALSFHPVICLSASKQVTDGLERRTAGFTYIQGSGDDHESEFLFTPLQGLTPTVFWRNPNQLLKATRSALPDLVPALRSYSDPPRGRGAGELCWTPIDHVSGLVSLCSTSTLQSAIPLMATSDMALVCLTSNDLRNAITIELSRLLCIPIPEGKKGQRHFLRTVLPQSVHFIKQQLVDGNKVCVACDSGTDTNVGVCMAVLALFFREDGSFDPQDNGQSRLSKVILNTRLQWIISSYPAANPTRTTLKRVNDFLLSPLSGGSHALKDGKNGKGG
ncbi:tRNA A64-2'-O-ribosylphosphate transferase [Pisolithus marmoratus]|nr:tRNA A64-2'-O-ribosylphosphate transferase [Pisolithus marmoratus]